MSNLTAEAILNELSKLRDNTGRAMSFAEGQTIVPNSLLTQVWEEAERKEQQRIIKLLEENFNCFDASNNQVDYMSLTDFIALIRGERR
jgi:hypothetical protein